MSIHTGFILNPKSSGHVSCKIPFFLFLELEQASGSLLGLYAFCRPPLYLPMPQSRHLTNLLSSSRLRLPQLGHFCLETLFSLLIPFRTLRYPVFSSLRPSVLLIAGLLILISRFKSVPTVSSLGSMFRQALTAINWFTCCRLKRNGGCLAAVGTFDFG